MGILETDKKENLKSFFRKVFFNFFPAYRRSGGRIIFISDDWKEIQVKLPHNRCTKNYVGTVFGGSIYASVDPIYMMQLIYILGNDYVVWDKGANINFIKPIRTAVYARFVINDALIAQIKQSVKEQNKYIFDLMVEYKDLEGITYATISKNMYVADRSYYNAKPK